MPLQLAATGAVSVAAIYFVAQGWRRANEMVWIMRAERLPNVSPEQAAALHFPANQATDLQKALAWEPADFETAYNIGECFRIQSLDGGDNYADLPAPLGGGARVVCGVIKERFSRRTLPSDGSFLCFP